MSDQPLLITVVLFGRDGTEQLCQPAFIKTSGRTPISKLMATFCRWLEEPETSLEFFLSNGRRLAEGTATPLELGLNNGGMLHARLAEGVELGKLPTGLPFLDVNDSELSALADLLSVGR
jgi:hypothetical protein